MARDAELRARITATDDASKVIDKVADKAQRLDDKDTRVDVDADTAEADRKLDAIDRQADALDRERVRIDVDADTTKAQGAMSKLGTAGGAAMSFLKNNVAEIATGAGAAIAAFAAKGVADFQDLALAAGKMRDALGLSAEDASRWVEVAGDIGISTEAVEKTFGKLIQTIGKSPDAFADMGIQLARTADGAVDVSETMLNVIEHLNGIQDPTRRAAEAQKLLGKNWKDAAELIAAGADNVRSSLEGVADAKIVDDKDIAQARRYRDAMDNLADVAEELSISLGETLVPILTDVANTVTTVTDAVKPLKGAFDDLTNIPVIKQVYENFAPWKQIPTRINQVKSAWDDLFGDGGPKTAKFEAVFTGGDFGAAADGIEEIEDAHDRGAAATERHTKAEEAHAEAVQRSVDALLAEADALNEQVDAALAAADQQLAVNDAMAEYAEVLKDDKASVDDVRDSAIDLAKATADLKTEQAAANGVTLTATQRLDNQNGALLTTAATAKGPARQAILDYVASVNQIPPDKMTEIRAAIDRGDLVAAELLLANVSAPRTAAVKADADTDQAEKDLEKLTRDRTMTVLIAQRAATGGVYRPPGTPIPTMAATASTTTVPVTMSIGSVPTNAEIARRIGRIKLPFSVASSLRADERLSGVRYL